MERKITGLTRFLLAAAIVTEATVACAPRRTNPVVTPDGDPTKNPTPTYVSPTRMSDIRDFLPTQTPTITPVPTETAIPTPAPTLEERFAMGPIDFSTTPLEATFGDDLKKLMSDASGAMTADIPLPVKSPDMGTEEQNATFERASWINIGGNPYFVFISDLSNQIFLYGHSVTSGAIGEVPRRITSFMIINPERQDEVIGKHVNLTINGQEIQGEVVFAEVMDNFDFYSSFSSYDDTANVDFPKNVLFARTDLFKIPEEIRSDQTPGVYYINIMACQSVDGYSSNNPVTGHEHNTARKALVTIKVQIP